MRSPEPPSLDAAALDTVPVAVIDLEMTGLDPEHDRIIEIGVVRAIGGEVERVYETLVRPGVPMTSDARRVTGIEESALAEAPPFEAVVAEVAALLDGAILVGHRAELDHAFLSAAMGRCGLTVAPATFDTLVMARNLMALRSHSLVSLCEALEVPRSVAHRALADAEATYGVFRRLLALIDPGGQKTAAELLREVKSLQSGSALRSSHRALLETAMKARTSVWIDYMGRDAAMRPAITLREVDVWGIDPQHLSGFCHLRGEHRVFRLDRIRRVTQGEKVYEMPAERPEIRRR
jgi:DNA polymerase III epsilon subunit family exonuclease